MISHNKRNKKPRKKKLEDVFRDEWIGHRVEAERHGNRYLGIVVFETRNTMAVDIGSRTLMLPKTETIFTRTYINQQIQVDGSKLVGRPEDRLKKRITRKW